MQKLAMLEFWIYFSMSIGPFLYGFKICFDYFNDPYTKEIYIQNRFIKPSSLFDGFYEEYYDQRKYILNSFLIPVLLQSFIYLIVSCVSKQVFSSMTHYLISLSCAIFLCAAYFSWYTVSVLLLLTTVCILIAISRIPLLHWLVGGAVLYSMDSEMFSKFNKTYVVSILPTIVRNPSSLFYPALALTVIRLISMTDHLKSLAALKVKDIVLSYLCIFYPVGFSLGTSMNFKDFHNAKVSPVAYPPVRALFSRFIRIVFWYAILEVNFMIYYTNSFFYSEDMSASRMVFFMCVVIEAWKFHLLYFIAYGITYICGRLDGLPFPEGPVCVFRTYLYSEMWRDFDHGLYLFLRNHIYIPMGGNRHGFIWLLIAKVSCFLFVLIYHGLELNIKLWISLNMLQIFLEEFICHLYRNTSFGNYLRVHLSPINIRRLTCVLASLSLQLSIYAIVFFFNGQQAGLNFFNKMFQSTGLVSFLAMSNICGYCYVQVCMTVNDKWPYKKYIK